MPTCDEVPGKKVECMPALEQDIQEYKNAIAQLNRMKAIEPFQNGREEHAAAILEEFFRTAKQSVVVFCKTAKAVVYDDLGVVRALRDCLERNISVQVIVQEETESTMLPELAREASAGGLPLRVVNARNKAVQELGVNFAVMDGRAYRLEMDTSKAEAVGCMNGPRLAKRLEDSFTFMMAQETAA